jgi:nickel/cobalt exporter
MALDARMANVSARLARPAASIALAALALLVAAPAALAHPLGNFTINHYAGLRVASDAIALDVVIDEAEIPTFEARIELDTNGDGDVSDAETDAARVPRCRALTPSLDLTVAGRATALELAAAGLSFASGAGGLPTMRLVCEYRAPIAPAIASRASIAFADASFAGQLGWREVTAVGDGMTLSDAPPTTSVSDRLRSYPAAMLATPLSAESVAFEAAPGGAAAPSFVAPDAQPVPGAPVSSSAASSPPSAVGAAAETPPAVPGGIGSEIDDLLRSRDLSPLVLLGSVLAALALGAGHALTPGHGKTLVGAYVVATRGATSDALLLGLAVAVSHTLGIVVLGAVVLAAGSVLPPATFARTAPILSAVTLTAVGTWLLLGHARRLRPRATLAHSHADPPAELSVGRPSRRGLFLVGLAGGLVPSTNALLILLAAIATNRPAFGLLLVVAFGLGMAAVMAGVALSLAHARDLLPRVGRLPLSRLARWGPPLAAAFVVALGLVLTVESLGSAPL